MDPRDFLDFLRTEAGQRLSAGCDTLRLAKSSQVSTPADPRNRVFIVLSGRLRVYLADDARELTLAFLEPGDIFTTHTPTYIRTVAASTVLTMDTRLFAGRLMEQPTLTPIVMRVLGKLLGSTVGIIENLAFRDVGSRLARFLADATRRRGQREGECWVVPLQLSLSDIAQLLGTTRQTVSGCISQMERLGIVARRGRKELLVCRLDALEQWQPAPQSQ